MDPSRKRRIRLVVALTAALLLAGALAYTSFSASSAAVEPSRLLASVDAGRSYQLTGKVVKGSIEQRGDRTIFRVRDRTGNASVPVSYVGAVPDTFRGGREVRLARPRGSLRPAPGARPRRTPPPASPRTQAGRPAFGS